MITYRVFHDDKTECSCFSDQYNLKLITIRVVFFFNIKKYY